MGTNSFEGVDTPRILMFNFWSSYLTSSHSGALFKSSDASDCTVFNVFFILDFFCLFLMNWLIRKNSQYNELLFYRISIDFPAYAL